MQQIGEKNNLFPGYYRIHEPDLELLSRLTILAKGEKRSINSFAKDCGVSPSTISRLINQKNNTPNTDLLIKAIAENADPQSGVTLDILLDAHGLGKVKFDTYENATSKQKIFAKSAELDKSGYKQTGTLVGDIARDLVINALQSNSWIVKTSSDRDLIYKSTELRFMADFVLETDALKAFGISKWAFDVYAGQHRPIMQKLSWIFGCCYVNPLIDQGIKMSLILTNREEFESAIRRLSTIQIHDMISIILINMEQMTIEQEYVIPMEDKCVFPLFGGNENG